MAALAVALTRGDALLDLLERVVLEAVGSVETEAVDDNEVGAVSVRLGDEDSMVDADAEAESNAVTDALPLVVTETTGDRDADALFDTLDEAEGVRLVAPLREGEFDERAERDDEIVLLADVDADVAPDVVSNVDADRVMNGVSEPTGDLVDVRDAKADGDAPALPVASRTLRDCVTVAVGLAEREADVVALRDGAVLHVMLDCTEPVGELVSWSDKVGDAETVPIMEELDESVESLDDVGVVDCTALGVTECTAERVGTAAVADPPALAVPCRPLGEGDEDVDGDSLGNKGVADATEDLEDAGERDAATVLEAQLLTEWAVVEDAIVVTDSNGVTEADAALERETPSDAETEEVAKLLALA